MNMNSTLERKGITRRRVRSFSSEASFGNYQQRRSHAEHVLLPATPSQLLLCPPTEEGYLLLIISLSGETSSRERHDAAREIRGKKQLKNETTAFTISLNL